MTTSNLADALRELTTTFQWDGYSDDAIENLREAADFIEQQEVIAQTYKELVDYILTVRLTNTHVWMEGLCDYINRWAEAVGDPDRAATYPDALQVITPQDMHETRPE